MLLYFQRHLHQLATCLSLYDNRQTQLHNAWFDLCRLTYYCVTQMSREKRNRNTIWIASFRQWRVRSLKIVQFVIRFLVSFKSQWFIISVLYKRTTCPTCVLIKRLIDFLNCSFISFEIWEHLSDSVQMQNFPDSKKSATTTRNQHVLLTVRN